MPLNFPSPDTKSVLAENGHNISISVLKRDLGGSIVDGPDRVTWDSCEEVQRHILQLCGMVHLPVKLDSSGLLVIPASAEQLDTRRKLIGDLLEGLPVSISHGSAGNAEVKEINRIRAERNGSH